jgi:glycosyltransferase involved in cell wall biosynthesis
VLDPAPPLLVFADDWGRHPSSCQHLIRHLLPRRQVIWVNTVGTRPPRFDMATAHRGWEKVCQWFRRTPARGSMSEVAPCVLNPRMWPWVSSAFACRLNRRLLVRQLLPVIQALSAPPVVVTTLPIVADLIGVLPVARWVYYCVDDFSLWPGLDGPALRRLEEWLVEGVDAIVAASEPLRDRLGLMTGRPVHLLTHGVDLDFWSSASADRISNLDGLERPLVVFWGVVDLRMDLEFVRRLASDLEHGTIVLAGPHNHPDPALLKLPRVVCFGSLPFEQLPRLAHEADVLVMPYADLPVTQAMQPLKLKEYLATGKPVVVRDLPATRAWADALDLADSAEAFSAAVRRRLVTGLAADQRSARERLAGESWEMKARAFERWISPRRSASVPAGVAVL